MFVKHKLSVQDSPNSIHYPEEEMLIIYENTGLTSKRIKEWVRKKRSKERKRLGISKKVTPYKQHEIAEMEAHLPYDYPPDRAAYKDFANRFGRTPRSIASWFYRKKLGILKNTTSEERTKEKLCRGKEENEILENYFNNKLDPSEDEIKQMAFEVGFGFSKIRKMQANHRLRFEKKVGKEKLQKRFDAGNFTVFDVDES